MTSEILIMTPNAIAMAADSVVTVSNKKTYEGVNKLFMLSNNPPMGIMIYSNANFFNFPMETIIKDFREKVKTLEKQFTTVKEFKTTFEQYLKKICESNNQLFFRSIKDEIDFFVEDFKKEIENNGNILHQIIPENLSIDLDKYVKKVNSVDFDSYFEEQVKELLDNSDEITLLKKIFFENKIYNQFTGVVISGFNQDDLFPSSISFKIITIDNSFVIEHIEENSVNKETSVVLTPFAKVDTITNFLNGIDDSTAFQIITYFTNVIEEYSDKLIQVINSSNIIDSEKSFKLNEINEEKNKICYDFSIFIDKLKKENHNPIIKSMESLPKEELANLSESLINITSMKLKVQDNLETVGGDVDVAIITKGDGFIWTKRKHYFDKALNPQFFRRHNY